MGEADHIRLLGFFPKAFAIFGRERGQNAKKTIDNRLARQSFPKSRVDAKVGVRQRDYHLSQRLGERLVPAWLSLPVIAPEIRAMNIGLELVIDAEQTQPASPNRRSNGLHIRDENAYAIRHASRRGNRCGTAPARLSASLSETLQVGSHQEYPRASTSRPAVLSQRMSAIDASPASPIWRAKRQLHTRLSMRAAIASGLGWQMNPFSPS